MGELRTYLATCTLFSSSRSAISVALAISFSSFDFCLWSSSAFRDCRDTSRRGSGVLVLSREGRWPLPQLTSLNCPLVLPTSSGSSSSSGLCTRTESSLAIRFLFAGVLVPLSSLRGVDTLPLACRRVMPPRSFRISSTLCTPSGAFGFFGRMYRSRWRPRLDEVKAWPQKGQFLSLAALSCGSAVERGVDDSVSPMMACRYYYSGFPSSSLSRYAESFMRALGRRIIAAAMTLLLRSEGVVYKERWA